MPSPSPLCQARYGANAYVNVPFGGPLQVVQSQTLDIRLADTAGVTTWDITCVSSDETSSLLAVTRDAPPAMVGHASIPSGIGKAWTFQSRVNGGVNANGQQDASLTTTFKVWVPASNGVQVGTLNETFEGDASFGWLKIFNAIARLAGSFTSPDGVLFGVSGAVQGLQYSTGDNGSVFGVVSGAFAKIASFAGDLRGNMTATYVKQITGDATNALINLFTSYNWPTATTALTATVGSIGRQYQKRFSANTPDVVTYLWPDSSDAFLDYTFSFVTISGNYIREASGRVYVKKISGVMTVIQAVSPATDPGADGMSNGGVAWTSTSNNLTLTVTPGSTSLEAFGEITGRLLKAT